MEVQRITKVGVWTAHIVVIRKCPSLCALPGMLRLTKLKPTRLLKGPLFRSAHKIKPTKVLDKHQMSVPTGTVQHNKNNDISA